MPEDALSWLAGRPRAVQTALLANPSGDLPPDIITRMPSLVVKTYRASNPDDRPLGTAPAVRDCRGRVGRGSTAGGMVCHQPPVTLWWTTVTGWCPTSTARDSSCARTRS